MAEYANREAAFGDSLPGRVGGFMLAVGMADGMARMQAVDITRQILELPNVELQQKISILNREDPLVFAASMPAALYTEARPFLAETADLNMSMRVNTKTSSEKSLDSKVDSTTKASARIGFFKIEQTIQASVSTHSNQTRESDYGAVTDMKLHMARHPLPEGLAKTLDAMNEFAHSANEINIALAKQSISEISSEADLALPEKVVEVSGEVEEEVVSG